jgi:hypothetical protein
MKKTGVKHDSEKAPLDLIPYEALEQIAKVLAFGASKYGRHNWKNGFEYSRLIAAALRHLNQYNAGEDADPESDISHVAHSACNLLMLLWMQKHKPELDNRWKKDEN